ncbi:MAG TPA: TetR/AcrR family transcriptional regulator [Terriglobales bacterium]|nr:TetR/AcrR family transcriptional regulator [Terriglobales bacterium]
MPRAVRESQMLEVAGSVFAARGFHEASMDEIAEAADISKPMIYNYFGSKEGLYFAYVDLSYRKIVAAIDAAVAESAAAGDGPDRQLRTGVRAYYRYVGEHQDAFRVLFREMGDPGGKLAGQRHRLSRRVANAIEGILRGGNALPPSHLTTDALAEAFLGAARSLADWWLDHSQVPADDIADQLMDLTLAGLRGPTDTPS